MDQFTYRDDQLYAEDMQVAAIAERFGTPCYIYSRAALEARFKEYQDALAGADHLICYAVKANSNLAVLDVLGRMGAGFDIVSGGEMERVIAAGGDPAKIVFSGVGKTPAEMARALDLDIACFNLESAQELEVLAEVAADKNTVARVSVRVNPDVDAQTHPYISTGLRENKFGVNTDEAMAVYRRAAELPAIEVVGIDCHIGSQLTQISPFIDALKRLLALVDQLAAEGITLHHLDLGGGLGVCYKDEQPPSVAEYIGAVRAELGDRPLQLVFEPGRSIAANAGLLVTRVNYLKTTEAHHFALVDAAMNDMIRPALYQAWLDIRQVDRGAQGQTAQWDVVGPVCETGDFLGKERELTLAPGDLLALSGAGAYGFTMSSNYNTRPRAAEIMIDGDQAHVVRAREVFEDMVRGECRLPE
ncbi:diaminopimelate decarboxylase [Halioglobus japonicus]|uniref:Diaminopimelate decarboxylase n=1 Tax=Halioglobus japonicus TaxID=930805 RepID=A0AAP8ME00_9GAMM|nr:diaminopimelate decarboxylase [Halioglobus japonicus]AQA17804.1 diaminopimelate decarboxylase [Halioglobus japonicus]PLW85759.1 diaminopimelate decarboxylase [Halioglobus japonicus]GHD17364.1 diaminopimelate decarboxylase [Halioglobus japonicus]